MSAGVILYGETTRELYDAWHARVGATPTIPQNEIQPLFNDIALYPCTSQVSHPPSLLMTSDPTQCKSHKL